MTVLPVPSPSLQAGLQYLSRNAVQMVAQDLRHPNLVLHEAKRKAFLCINHRETGDFYSWEPTEADEELVLSQVQVMATGKRQRPPRFLVAGVEQDALGRTKSFCVVDYVTHRAKTYLCPKLVRKKAKL